MGSHVLQHLDSGEPALPSTAESPGGLGSPYRPVQHNPGSGAGGPPPLLSRRQPSHRAGTKAVSSTASRKAPGSLARSAGGGQRENGGGLSKVGRAKGGTDSSNPRKAPDPRHRRQYCLLLVCKNPLFLLGLSGADEVPFRSRWRRMNTESGLGSRRLHL